MFDVVDLSEPRAPTPDVADRVEAIYAQRKPPDTGVFVDHALIGKVAAGLMHGAGSHVIPHAQQRWWRCPCGGGEAREACPHAVCYGRVQDRDVIAFISASYFDVRPDGCVVPVTIGVECVDDIDVAARGLDQVGQPGLATMLMAWLEMGLRDALIVALGERARA